MTIFFSDLDNTLIYSHRHPIPESKICVEELHGKQQSFMTRNTFDYFRHLQWLELVPLTTRTADQYARLAGMAEALHWRSALICNGAVLLTEGKEDPEWRKESLLSARKDQAAYEELYSKAYDRYGKDSIVSADPFLFYIKGTDVDAEYRYLSRIADLSHLNILKDSRKIYCIPSSFSKGRAIRRYMERRGGSCCIAAGDSEFDLSMREQADVFLCPEKLIQAEMIQRTERRMRADTLHSPDRTEPEEAFSGRTISCGGFFADSLCKELETIRKERETVRGTVLGLHE